jgi:hypothetical protein
MQSRWVILILRLPTTWRTQAGTLSMLIINKLQGVVNIFLFTHNISLSVNIVPFRPKNYCITMHDGFEVITCSEIPPAHSFNVNLEFFVRISFGQNFVSPCFDSIISIFVFYRLFPRIQSK